MLTSRAFGDAGGPFEDLAGTNLSRLKRQARGMDVAWSVLLA
jgi:hypothetical protein